jgi:predicted ATP-grasp superfamily ATP-dependent carboligase
MKNLWKKFKSLFNLDYPLVLKKEDEIDLKNLNKKTKKELEKLGRKVGIELDKRLTKDKLIKQIRKHSK